MPLARASLLCVLAVAVGGVAVVPAYGSAISTTSATSCAYERTERFPTFSAGVRSWSPGQTGGQPGGIRESTSFGGGHQRGPIVATVRNWYLDRMTSPGYGKSFTLVPGPDHFVVMIVAQLGFRDEEIKPCRTISLIRGHATDVHSWTARVGVNHGGKRFKAWAQVWMGVVSRKTAPFEISITANPRT
jgi:hypothetical protein